MRIHTNDRSSYWCKAKKRQVLRRFELLSTLMMLLFCTPSLAAQQPRSLFDAFGSVMPMLLAVGLFLYFMVIQPQKNRDTQHQTMLDRLSEGDEVMTAGGIVGRVVSIKDSFVEVQIGQDPKMRIVVQKHKIDLLMPKGTIRNL